jgi:hypothetical protein
MRRRNPFLGQRSPRFAEQYHARRHQRHATQWLLKHREAEFDVIARIAALMNVGESLSEQLTIALELVSQVLKTDFLAIFVHHASGPPVCAGSVVKRGDKEAFARHCEALVVGKDLAVRHTKNFPLLAA